MVQHDTHMLTDRTPAGGGATHRLLTVRGPPLRIHTCMPLPQDSHGRTMHNGHTTASKPSLRPLTGCWCCPCG